jgi:glycosyltransferase involved in cell wall biosynthesis
VVLSNVFDQQYHDRRGEPIERCLSGAKRRDLFRCLEVATGRLVIVLSSPPKAAERRHPRWLPSLRTQFSTHDQFFCANWDAPKVRVPLSWFFYMFHVLRNTRSGDLVLIDNFEFIYVLAAYWLRLFKRVSFVLDYEDGKHLIDRSWTGILSRAAEFLGRRLLSAALLAHPALGRRLASSIPTALVPGFVLPGHAHSPWRSGEPVRFVYSGSLDRTRGVDLLLESLDYLPPAGWRLDISGAGPLGEKVATTTGKWASQVKFHGSLTSEEHIALLQSCHVGLNCQRASDAISGVTFPSKIFTYLSAGLLVLSSTASEVKQICGKACSYYESETARDLAASMSGVLDNFETLSRSRDVSDLSKCYSVEGTAERLRSFFQSAGLI